jgi:hypothetical protein
MARKQPRTWSLTTPTFCMNAYTLVGPTNRYPCAFNCALVGPREHREARRGGPHRPRVLDGCRDLGAVADDRGILQQLVDVALRHRRDLLGVEVMEGAPERVALAEHDRPAEPGLEHPQRERLEQRRLVVRARAPDLIVVAAEGGVAGPSPRAARLSVVTDDHVVAHEPPIVQAVRPRRIARLSVIRCSKESANTSGRPCTSLIARSVRSCMRAPGRGTSADMTSRFGDVPHADVGTRPRRAARFRNRRRLRRRRSGRPDCGSTIGMSNALAVLASQWALSSTRSAPVSERIASSRLRSRCCDT